MRFFERELKIPLFAVTAHDTHPLESKRAPDHYDSEWLLLFDFQQRSGRITDQIAAEKFFKDLFLIVYPSPPRNAGLRKGYSPHTFLLIFCDRG
ncbi:MAG: hypothetical protein UX68_C0031G0009 [Parcubacteria group bacterium GW2011_GWA2_46_9]|nr:MAG: hypothetical protein UX68_C0031G0009 [Parcubacteria group bacterium GW2011_GWA2_46_9]